MSRLAQTRLACAVACGALLRLRTAARHRAPHLIFVHRNLHATGHTICPPFRIAGRQAARLWRRLPPRLPASLAALTSKNWTLWWGSCWCRCCRSAAVHTVVAQEAGVPLAMPFLAVQLTCMHRAECIRPLRVNT